MTCPAGDSGGSGRPGRHMLNYKGWPGEELKDLVHLAQRVKGAPQRYYDALAHRTLTMLFQKTSTRTRLSFEAGMTELGGHAVFLDWRASNFVLAEVADEARYLTRNCHGIMARLLKFSDLAEISRVSTVPVINGCCEKYHPCQGLADLLTVYERFGRFDGVHLVYLGVHNNVANSLIEGGTKVGLRVTTVTPIQNPPSLDEELLAEARATGLWTSTLDIRSAVKDADVVYTDSWIDMESFLDPEFEEEKKRRLAALLPYQLNGDLLRGSRALIMHDMPVHAGYEITREMVESDRAVIFQQAENRMHAQKALLLRLLA